MNKTMIAGAVALTLAGAGFAVAQQQQAPQREQQRTERRDMPRWQPPSAEDVAAFTDARIAALKAGIRMSAEQEKHWPAVEQAMRDLAKQRADRMKEFSDRMHARREARRNDTPPPAAPDTIDRLRRGADTLSTRGAALKKLADAADPLYKSLDEGQKRRFDLLLQAGGRQGPQHWRHHWQRRADNAPN
jgi:hypothetical protein